MCENTDSRCTTIATVRGTRLCAGGVSRFLCLSFFAAAKKVSAAPHRGDTNKPIRNQGKANTVGKTTRSAPQANKPRKDQRHRQNNQKRAAGNQPKKAPACKAPKPPAA